MNIIFGSSGMAKEVDYLLYDNNHSYTTDFFIDLEEHGKFIMNSEVISEKRFFEGMLPNIESVNIYFGVGSPLVRKAIYDKISSHSELVFPNAIHRSVNYDTRAGGVSIDEANIVCAGSNLTTNIVIGNNNHVNQDCTIGHDVVIGNFNTISPGVHVSGNIRIGDNVFIGAGAVLLERINIASNSVIGAGAVVTKSIIEPGTYVGTPAKRIK